MIRKEEVRDHSDIVTLLPEDIESFQFLTKLEKRILLNHREHLIQNGKFTVVKKTAFQLKKQCHSIFGKLKCASLQAEHTTWVQDSVYRN